MNTVNKQNKSIPTVNYTAQTLTKYTFLVCSRSLNFKSE